MFIILLGISFLINSCMGAGLPGLKCFTCHDGCDEDELQGHLRRCNPPKDAFCWTALPNVTKNFFDDDELTSRTRRWARRGCGNGPKWTPNNQNKTYDFPLGYAEGANRTRCPFFWITEELEFNSTTSHNVTHTIPEKEYISCFFCNNKHGCNSGETLAATFTLGIISLIVVAFKTRFFALIK